MNFKQFKEIVECLAKVRDRSHIAYQNGIDLMDYDEDYHTIIVTLMKSVFDEEGCDWINWFLYERIEFDGKILSANDAFEICHNIESLWETVKPFRKQ